LQIPGIVDMMIFKEGEEGKEGKEGG